MNYILLVFMNLLFIIIIVNEYRVKSLSILFWSAAFLTFSLPHSLDIILGSNLYPTNVLTYATIYVLLFNLMFLLLRSVTTYMRGKGTLKLFGEEKILYSDRENKFINCLFSLLGLSTLLLIIGIIDVSGSIINSSWSDGTRISSIFSLPARYFFITSGSILLFQNIIQKGVLVKFLSFIFIVINVLITRARILLIPPIVPIAMYYIFQKDTKSSFLKSIVVATFFVIAVFFIQDFRYLGSISNALTYDFLGILRRSIERIISGEGEFSLRNGFYYFIYNEVNHPNFYSGATYIRLLFLPFPSSIIKVKPRDLAMDMWDVINPTRTGIGGTYHPTFWGDLYGNFGDYGILLFIIWVFFFSFIDYIFIKSPYIIRISLMAPYATMYFLLARGAIYNAITIGFYSTIAISIIYLITRIKLKR